MVVSLPIRKQGMVPEIMQISLQQMRLWKFLPAEVILKPEKFFRF
jgi:hypothetical protein